MSVFELSEVVDSEWCSVTTVPMFLFHITLTSLRISPDCAFWATASTTRVGIWPSKQKLSLSCSICWGPTLHWDHEKAQLYSVAYIGKYPPFCPPTGRPIAEIILAVCLQRQGKQSTPPIYWRLPTNLFEHRIYPAPKVPLRIIQLVTASLVASTWLRPST